MLYARTDRFLIRVQAAVHNAVTGFLDHALTNEEKSELGVLLYDYSLRRSDPHRGLWRWEKKWFDEQLPKPPARLLIGAAGTGREAVALAEAGYQIDAFEPAPLAAKKCAEALGDRGRVFVGRYEDLNRAVIDSAGGPLSEIASESYDAIILGWGSLTHVIDEEERKRLLQSCRILGKDAPILASFWISNFDQSKMGVSPFRKAGFRFGSIVATLRDNRAKSSEDVFRSQYGFAHFVAEKEIEKIAAVCESRVISENKNNYPHVTFIPK